MTRFGLMCMSKLSCYGNADWRRTTFEMSKTWMNNYWKFQVWEKNTSRKEGASTPPHCSTRIKTLSFLFFHQLDFLTDKDIEKLNNITKVVLLPEKTTAQRKARVSKYLQWVSSCNSLALAPVSGLNSSHLGFLRIGSLRIDDFCTTPPLDCVTCSLRMLFWALASFAPKATTLVRAICRRLRNSRT